MGSKTRLGSYCTKRANNGVNLVTSRNINTRLARPIAASFYDREGLVIWHRFYMTILKVCFTVLGKSKDQRDKYLMESKVLSCKTVKLRGK